MRSGQENFHNYESEFWEFQYETYRYLGGVEDETLVRRYSDILRNVKRLISRERDVIPIKSVLSSWYWLRKEHQTRLEFYIRGVPLPEEPPTELPENTSFGSPVWPKHPNACDVIFRFGKKQFIEPMLSHGEIRVCPASLYKDGIAEESRIDDELTKIAMLPKAYCKITTKNGEEIPPRSDISRSVSSENYYVLCSSCGYHRELFSDFKADCCIIITNLLEFEKRIEAATEIQLPGWYFVALPVEYFDPYELGIKGFLDPVLSKDFAFAYQMEFRFFWVSLKGEAANNFKYIKLGSLDDLAQLYFCDDA